MNPRSSLYHAMESLFETRCTMIAPLAVAAFLLTGHLGFPAVSQALSEGPAVDECGRPLAPIIKSLEADGAGLVLTVEFPLSEQPHEGVWVAQYDAAGEFVGEVFVDPGSEPESTATIPDGLRAALDRGPAFTLDLLDASRRLIEEDVAFIVRLDCAASAACTLEPVLGVAPGAASHVSADLLAVLDSLTESGEPISIEGITVQYPELAGPILDLFWQSSFQASTSESCECRWLLATEVTPLTGGAHLVWANTLAPPQGSNDRYLGDTELHVRLICTLVSQPQLYATIVDVGEPVEIFVPDRWGPPCDASCEPRVTHSLLYKSKALVNLPPSDWDGPFPSEDDDARVRNEGRWYIGSNFGNASLVEWSSTTASINTPLVVGSMASSSMDHSSYSFSRFEGATRIVLQHGFGLSALLASKLDMYATADACESIPELGVSFFVTPLFRDGNVNTEYDRCRDNFHTSLVIRTGG